MATYSFRIKKGKYQLDLSTSDKGLLVEQFEKWVKDATAYARKKKATECKELVNSQIKAEEEVTKKNIENHLARHPISELPSLEKEHTKKEQLVKEPSKEDNLDIFYAPPVQEKTVESIQQNQSGGVFDNILNNSLNNPKTELSFKSTPTIKKDNAFLNYITTRKIERKIDYLLLTAYYFTQYE